MRSLVMKSLAWWWVALVILGAGLLVGAIVAGDNNLSRVAIGVIIFGSGVGDTYCVRRRGFPVGWRGFCFELLGLGWVGSGLYGFLMA